ncbi:glycoside hydrolase superfamily, partial [Obelidium mucronatum]
PGVIGYWTNWSPYSRSENSIDKLDLTGFTAINYAFLNTDANGGLVSFDPIKDAEWIPKFNAVKSKYPNLRTIVSIGGWSGSRTFSTIAKSATLIQTFATNILNFLSTNGFDGVDIDWEYPGGNGVTCNAVDPMDAKNFVDMLAALRAKLGPTRSISIAGSAETSRYVINGTNYIPEYMKYINYAQVMSYDFYGSWVSHSDFNSPLDVPGASDPQEPAGNNNGYTTPMTQKSSIGLWLAAGASASQLTNGLAFYGRSWSVQSNANNGLYQLCTGSVNGAACDGIVGDFLDNKNNGPAGTWCDPCNVCYYSGVWMYNNLRGQALAAYGAQPAAPLASGPLTASNGWNRQYFAFAQNPTLYTANYNGKSSFIAYDDPTSIQAKAAWAKSAGLGGTMIWELSQDYNKELVNAVRAGWGA